MLGYPFEGLRNYIHAHHDSSLATCIITGGGCHCEKYLATLAKMEQAVHAVCNCRLNFHLLLVTGNSQVQYEGYALSRSEDIKNGR